MYFMFKGSTGTTGARGRDGAKGVRVGDSNHMLYRAMHCGSLIK